MSFFEIKNISCIRGQKLLFKNLNFKLNNKDLIVIKGPNGSGKTTLLKAVFVNILLSQQIGYGFYDKANIFLYKNLMSHVGHSLVIFSLLSKFTPSGMILFSSPFGPFTVIVNPLISTDTLSGIGTGDFPILDIINSP